MSHAVHPIEAESYRILRARVDLSHLPALVRAVTERVVHASADLEYADTLLADEAALVSGREALLAGAPVVCDTRMVAGGITRREATVPLLDPRAAQLAASEGITRTAAAMRLAVAETGAGARSASRPARRVSSSRISVSAYSRSAEAWTTRSVTARASAGRCERSTRARRMR